MRYHIIILQFCILIYFLGACIPQGISNSPTPVTDDTLTTDRVTITFGHFEQYRSFYEPLIDDFNAQNPDIQVLFVALDELLQTTENRDETLAQSVDTMGALPRGLTNWQRYLYNLTPLIDADPAFEPNDYYPGTLETLTFDDGSLYTLPSAAIIPVLSYNQTLFEQADVPLPTNDWQWGDLRAAAEQIAQKEQDAVTTYGLLARTNGSLALLGELQAANALLADLPPGEGQLDDPSVRTAVQEVISMADSGALYVEQSTDRDLTMYSNLIKNGQVGIWFTGSVDSEPSFETGTVALPPLPIPFELNIGYAISNGTSYPSEAWRWLTFLSRQYTPPTSGDLNSGVHVPARRSITEETQHLDQFDIDTRQALETMLARESSEPSALINLTNNYLRDVVYAVLYQDQSLDQALQEAQEVLAADRLAEQNTQDTDTDPAPVAVATPILQTAPADATTITFASNVANLQPLVDQFHREQVEVFVQLEAVANPSLTDLANTTDCFVTWAPPTPAQRAALRDLRPLWDADTSLSRDVFPSTVLAPFEQDGALYGLPHRMDIPTLHYNPALFDAANLPYPTADWSLEDFVAAATQLTQEQDNLHGFAVVGDHTTALEWWLQRTEVASGQETDGLTWTDSDMLATLQGYVDLLTSTSPHNRLAGYTRTADPALTAQLVTEGQVAMWLESGITFGEPNATIAEAAVAPLPGGTFDNRADDVSVTTGLYIAADTPHTDACWQWLRYLSADTTSLGGGFPARTDVAIPPTETQSTGHAEVYTIYQEALAQTTQGQEPPFFLRNPDLDPFWFYQALDQALQGANLEQELTTAQQMSEAYVTCVDAGGVGSDCAVETDPEYAGWQIYLLEEAADEEDEEE